MAVKPIETVGKAMMNETAYALEIKHTHVIFILLIFFHRVYTMSRYRTVEARSRTVLVYVLCDVIKYGCLVRNFLSTCILKMMKFPSY